MRKVGWRAMPLIVCHYGNSRSSRHASHITRRTRRESSSNSRSSSRSRPRGGGLGAFMRCSRPVRGTVPRTTGPILAAVLYAGVPAARGSHVGTMARPRQPTSKLVLDVLKCSVPERSASIVFPRFHRKPGAFPAPVDLCGHSIYFRQRSTSMSKRNGAPR